MGFRSLAVALGTADEAIFQMPAMERRRDGQWVVSPYQGAAVLSVVNTGAAAETVTFKLQAQRSGTPLTIGSKEVAAGDTVKWPVPIALQAGETLYASATTADVLHVSGSVSVNPQSPQKVETSELFQRFVVPYEIDHALAWAIATQAFGAPVAGGYYAGIIDTVTGTIQSSPMDAYQTGQRFALIVSPKSLEAGAGKRWDIRAAGSRADIPGAETRWNGLEATQAVLAVRDAMGTYAGEFEVHDYIDGLTAAETTRGGSDWYLPAMDELELCYRNLKPKAADNFTSPRSAAFPGTQQQGENPSSAPQATPYTNDPRDPMQTPLALFQTGGAQALDQARYWTATQGGPDLAWLQIFTRSGVEGYQDGGNKDTTDLAVRPVRRVVF